MAACQTSASGRAIASWKLSGGFDKSKTQGSHNGSGHATKDFCSKRMVSSMEEKSKGGSGSTEATTRARKPSMAARDCCGYRSVRTPP